MSPQLRESQMAGSNRQKADQRRIADLPPLRLRDLPSVFLSIDPGSTHCGVARWEVDRMGGPTTVRLVEVYERSPDALYIELRALRADGVGLVIAEDFRLQKSRNAQGSRLVTPRVLGVIEYLCRMEGVWYREQVPSIKPSVDAWLRAQVPHSHGGGLEVEALASNTHKRDAVRHGLYPALRNKADRDEVRLILTEHERKRGRPKPVSM